jgi:membrane fusion protein (multidrug efflux system)
MASPFFHTLRSLEADRHDRWIVAFIPAVALLVAWLVWFFIARVSVYEVSDDARLEAEDEAHPVVAPVDGRIAAVHARLGEEVSPGFLLFELEAGEQRYRLAEEEARGGALTGELTNLDHEIEAERRALTAGLRGARASLAEAAARTAQATTAVRLAAAETARSERLHAAGMLPLSDLERARAAEEQLRAAATALESSQRRLRFEQATAVAERQARLGALERDRAELAGQVAMASASGGRMRFDVGLRAIRAPVGGRLGELAPLRVGSFVSAGDRLGAVVPGGRLKVVARYPPALAAGRIHPGQLGRLRLAGYPSTQYGALDAVVSGVASEVRDGALRVELRLSGRGRPLAGPALPLQHGMPGTVEVEVERVPPAAVVLRILGKLLEQRAPPPGTAGGVR